MISTWNCVYDSFFSLLVKLFSSLTLIVFFWGKKVPHVVYSPLLLTAFLHRKHTAPHFPQHNRAHSLSALDFSLVAFCCLTGKKQRFEFRICVQFSFIESLRWFWILINSATRKKTIFFESLCAQYSSVIESDRSVSVSLRNRRRRRKKKK